MSEENEVTAKAAEMGWVTKEEWKGDPDKWRPAEEFVSRGENILPILKDRVSKLESDLKVALSANKHEIEQVKKESYARAKAEYEKQLADLEKLEVEAFKTGDADAYLQVKDAKAAIKAPVEPEHTAEDPVFVDWKEKNPWYQTDKEMADYADFISHKIMAEHGGKISKSALAEEMTKRTKAAFPGKFTNPKREDPGSVEGGTGGPSGKKNGKTFGELPESAKSQYARMAKNFERQGRKFTKEQYAEAYFEQQ